MHHRTHLLTSLASLLVLLLAPGLLAATAPTATPQAIDAAIKRGVEYLYSKQANGHWETADKRDPTTKQWDTEGGQFGGRTALVTYALLAADQSPQNERIIQA